jgi:hypothetical protein
LNPNKPAEWEMRIDEIRVIYDIDYGISTVKIECIARLFHTKVLPFRQRERHTQSRRKTAQRNVVPSRADKDTSREEVSDFGQEVEITRATRPLMTLLTERAAQPSVLSLQELKKQLGITA